MVLASVQALVVLVSALVSACYRKRLKVVLRRTRPTQATVWRKLDIVTAQDRQCRATAQADRLGCIEIANNTQPPLSLDVSCIIYFFGLSSDSF